MKHEKDVDAKGAAKKIAATARKEALEAKHIEDLKHGKELFVKNPKVASPNN